MEMEKYLDDNVVVPDWIRKMTPEELEKAIKQLEKELFSDKEKKS